MAMDVTQLPEAKPRERKVAIGTFDGVHVGHRQVIEGSDTVLTFEPHPVRVIHPEAAPKLIMNFNTKRDVIAGLGVSELVVIPFDRAFSQISAEEFIEDILVQKLGATHVSIGENFRFGAKAKGDQDMLEQRGEFETRIVPLVEADGETISSTRIRALVLAGDVETAMHGLGAPFLMEGEVVKGDQRGRELGFPTANIVPDDELVCPGHGVYAGFADGRPAAIHIGVRPMFETGRGVLVEPHLIDFDGDLYGKTLRLAFIARLRGEKRFPSVEDLIAQMRRDVDEAREICVAFKGPAPSASR